MDNPVEQFRQAAEATIPLMEHVSDDQWGLPTPCEGWTVRDLSAHLRGSLTGYASAFGGGQPPTPDDLSDADALRSAVSSICQAMNDPAALDRPVQVPIGKVPAAVALRLGTTELLTHGWDLARALDVPFDPPREVTEGALAFSRQALAQIPADRSPFGPSQPVDESAPAIDHLAGLLGRSVR